MLKKSDNFEYDVIVIGAGHAGCEAALASARNEAKTLLITINIDSIALMPCNSAIGGPGRGHLVREIDVLGGEMAKNADRTFLHMRMLNTSRGPAVRTLRAIVDKRRYSLCMKKVLENQGGLFLKQGLVSGIEKSRGIYIVTTSDNSKYESRCIIICAGTFLRAKIFWGSYEIEAGRQGEINSKSLPRCLEDLGYEFGRLKTDTPPRVDKKSIDENKLKIQEYDKNPEMFSHDGNFDGRKQENNYIAYVNEECIRFIKDNVGKTTVYGKKLTSEGPRYCPSIEDKIVRFPEKKRHLVFIQPEGWDTNEMYLHGLSTTFSEEMQLEMIRKIMGLEKAEITRPGYGVEYDYLLPFQINNFLESKKHPGLFFAGQINGTTGYEEAASQGIYAGINAARYANGSEKMKIKREDGYLGILVDDLTIKGVSEPYRMLTSRNEYRLAHRHDNSDYRIMKFLYFLGKEKEAEKINAKYSRINSAIERLYGQNINKYNYMNKIIKGSLTDAEIDNIKKEYSLNTEELNSLFINIKYKDYLKRENDKINNIKESLDSKIPSGIDYDCVANLSNEARRKLKIINPLTLEQASRIEGVGPADIFSLLCYIRNVSRETNIINQ